MQKIFYIILFIFFKNHTNNINDKEDELAQNTEKYKKSKFFQIFQKQKKGNIKFVLRNKQGDTLNKGSLQWDLDLNIWIITYDDGSVYIIQNFKVIKKHKNTIKYYPCSGFIKIFAQPLSKWDTVIEFDSEICINDIYYLEFKTNKSYFVISFKLKPFKFLKMQFEDGQTLYIFDFEDLSN